MRERIHSALKKTAIIVLGVLTIGLPASGLIDYLLLLAVVLVVVLGRASIRPVRFVAIVSAVAAIIVIRGFVSPDAIEEGHNVFVTDPSRPNSALKSGLPPPVFTHMKTEFDAAYPAGGRCQPGIEGCWRYHRSPDRTYAFSSEGIYDRPAMSRRVYGISFNDPAWLRLGFLNDLLGYNWYNGVSDVERGRPSTQWGGRRVLWHQTMPWFVAYRFPADYVGSRLCWRGTLLWEGADNTFPALESPWRTCRTIEAADVGRAIFGIAIKPNAPLAMTLRPKTLLRVWQALDFILMFGALALLVLACIRPRLERLLLPVVSIAAAAAVLWVVDPTLFGGLHVHMGGDDGLVHEGFGQLVLKSLSQGDFYAALRGGENVFYFNPGFRYLRALEKAVFGDTNFGYVTLLLLLPLAVFLLFRRFSGRLLGLLAVLLFITSVGEPLGLSLPKLGVTATFGYPDPVGFGLFLMGLLPLVGLVREQGYAIRAGGCFPGTALLALAVFTRPNLFPLAAIVVTGAVVMLWSSGNWRAAAAALFGFSFVGVMALHNWVFGGMFVPFGSNAFIKDVYKVSPIVYLKAAGDLVRLEWSNDSGLVYNQLEGWIRGPTGKPAFGFLHAAQIVIVLYVVAAPGKFEPWLRWIGAAALAGHAMALLYVNTPRYHWMTWLLTSLVMFGWLRRIAGPLLQDVAIRDSVLVFAGRVRKLFSR